MKKLLFIALISMLLLVSCKGQNISKGPNIVPNKLGIQDYYPLIANAKYTYIDEGYVNNGNELVFVDFLDNKRIQTRTYDGEIRVLKLNEGQLIELFSRPETYFRENFIDDEYTTGKVLLKEPLTVGNSWPSGENSISTITSVNKEIMTAEGNIESIEVTTENTKGATIEYYAKNKGLIKVVKKGPGYEVTSTLSSIQTNLPLTQIVTIFYPDIDGANLRTMDVQVSYYTNDEPKKVIAQMFKDFSVYEIISKNTKINELYFNKDDNSVHIDLTKEFVTEMNVAAGFESMILESLTNTLGLYYRVQEIYLTIDGGTYESGHILLEEGKALNVDYSNISNMATE